MKKIFIIGKDRSGTKWLSNIIANHDKIACVQRPGAGGILETNIIYRMPNIFGDLKKENNFIGFIELFSKTNFFKLLDIKKEKLYKAPKNYLDFLDYILTIYAKNKNKSFWLQKTSTIKLNRIYKKFPSAKFVIIERNPIDNIRSTIGLKVRKKIKANNEFNQYKKNIIKELVKYLLAEKRINKLRNKNNIKHVYFEDLKNSKENTIRDICKFLKINFNKNLLKDHYKKNTSFNGVISKRNVINKRDILLIKSLYPIMRKLPLFLFEKLHKINTIFRDSFIKERFIPGTFEFFKKELMKNNLID